MAKLEQIGLISVIIPAYNRAKYLPRAIDSVLTQTYSNLEVIVIDDGSDDNTQAVVQRYIEQDPRVRLVKHERRKGAQAARNTGIRAAKGKWIAFLDSDDHFSPDSLKVRLQAVAEKMLNVVHSACSVLNAGTTNLQQSGVPPDQGWVYKELLRRPGPMFPGLMVSKEALVQIGYLDEAIVSYQEWDTAIRLSKHYEFAWVPEPTFIYNRQISDTISSNLLSGAMGYEQIVRKHRWEILRYLGPRGLSFHYQTLADSYQGADSMFNVRRCRFTAAMLWPCRPRLILRKIRGIFKKHETKSVL